MVGVAALLSVAACTSNKAPVNSVAGTIQIKPELVAGIQPQASLYLIARDADAPPHGPPVAVRRFAPPFTFPIAFVINSHDAMIPGQSLPQSLSLSARIAQKGGATPVNPGDFVSAQGAVKTTLGTGGVTLTLDALLK